MGNCLPAETDNRAGGGLSKGSKTQLGSFSELQTSSLASKSERSEWVATLAQVLEESSGTEIEKRYQLGEELGRGEFGVTRRCKDVETGESFACKSISKEKLQTEVDIEDVRREVRIMRHLPCHPNIVRLREVFEDSHAVHLVMELCEGGELFERIVARGHYTERAAAAVTKTVVEVVKLCHEHGVMHRDLKPENFLYADKSETSSLKTIDFGLSIFFKPGQRFNEVVGSPYYMAPEILRRNYGPEADVWSAGIILYILLCGVPPFWAEDEDEIAQLIVESEQSDIDFEREPWPKISANAKELVRSMLDPNPYSRLTAGEVLEHPWLKNVNSAPNIPLGETVRTRLKQFSAMNKLKKRALRILAEHITGEEVDGIKQMFQMMDTKKNGNLTFEELKEGLQKMGEPVQEPDVKMLMEAADVDGNGTLDCNEFVTVSVHLKRISSDDHLSEAFKFFDKNGNGFIEIDELKETLLEGDHSAANMKMIADIICDVDTDKDGRISYQEFAYMMKAGTDWRNASRQYSRALLNTLSKKLIRGVSKVERNAPNL